MDFRPELSGNEKLKQKWKSGEYDDLLSLRQELLSVSGAEMVPAREPDLDAMVTKGSVIEPTNIVIIEGQTSECHQNSALLYQNNKSVTEIGTGWALSEDGLWRQHSWVMKNSELIETTIKRTKYYGILLKNTEAEEFVSKNLY